MLIFDEEKHIYLMDGRQVMSVTQAINHDVDKRWFCEKARKRGQDVHKAINLDINDKIGFESFEDGVSPFFKSWLSFKQNMNPIFKLNYCEKPMYNSMYDYAGTPDIVAIMNGKMCLIDIKTGSDKNADLQTAAYAELDELRNERVSRFSLRLFKTGDFKLTIYNNQTDFIKFLVCLKKAKEKNEYANAN